MTDLNDVAETTIVPPVSADDTENPPTVPPTPEPTPKSHKRLILILVAVALIVTGVLVWRTREAQAHQHVLQACTVQVKKVTTAQAGSHDES